jgi:hypothetical protein
MSHVKFWHAFAARMEAEGPAEMGQDDFGIPELCVAAGAAAAPDYDSTVLAPEGVAWIKATNLMTIARESCEPGMMMEGRKVNIPDLEVDEVREYDGKWYLGFLDVTAAETTVVPVCAAAFATEIVYQAMVAWVYSCNHPTLSEVLGFEWKSVD